MVPSNQELYRSSLGRDEIRLLSADFRVKLVLARVEKRFEVVDKARINEWMDGWMKSLEYK